MPWIVDGSNVLGAIRADLHSEDAKRELVRRASQFARTKRTRVVVVFDGPQPPSFACQLGPVTVVFSGADSADDVIARRTASGRGWSLVTADRGLATRAGRREVRVVAPSSFVSDLEAAEGGGEGAADEDWMAWFSDPKNRSEF